MNTDQARHRDRAALVHVFNCRHCGKPLKEIRPSGGTGRSGAWGEYCSLACRAEGRRVSNREAARRSYQRRTGAAG